MYIVLYNIANNNTKKISIQLFSSSLKNSSKSTPMMSFKSPISSVVETKDNYISNKPKERPKLEKKETITPSNMKNPYLLEKAKDKNRLRKSITSKEEIAKTNEIKMGDIKSKSSNGVLASFKANTNNNYINNKQNTIKENEYKNKSNKKLIKTNTNILTSSNQVLTTNYTDVNKDMITHIKTDEDDYIATRQRDDYLQSDIISSIQNLGNIIKSNNPNQNVMNTVENKNKINNLNCMLNNYKLNESDVMLDTSKNLLMDNNRIRRDTFIDNNFNKKIRTVDPETKGTIINEIYTNSDMRIKRYGILFDFINTNIREITDMMSVNNKIIPEDIDDDITKLNNDEVNHNMFPDISASFIASSSCDGEFYKNLAEQTFNFTNVNWSNELSTYKVDISNMDKLEITECEYDMKDTLVHNDSCNVLETETIRKKEPMYL